MNKEALDFFENRKRAKIICINCIAKPTSLKKITGLWFEENTSTLYQKGGDKGSLVSNMYNLGILDNKGKEGKDELFQINPDFFVDVYYLTENEENQYKEEIPELNKKDFVEHRKEIKDYLDSNFIKKLYSPENLKKIFGTTENLLNEWQQLWGGLLYTYPAIAKEMIYKNNPHAKIPPQLKELLKWQFLASGLKLNFIKYLELIEEYKTILMKTAIPDTCLTRVWKVLFEKMGLK